LRLFIFGVFSVFRLNQHRGLQSLSTLIVVCMLCTCLGIREIPLKGDTDGLGLPNRPPDEGPPVLVLARDKPKDTFK